MKYHYVRKACYDDVDVDIYCDVLGSYYIPRNHIGLALGYSNPDDAIIEMGEKDNCISANAFVTDKKIVVYSDIGIEHICKKSRKKNAIDFLSWFYCEKSKPVKVTGNEYEQAIGYFNYNCNVPLLDIVKDVCPDKETQNLAACSLVQHYPFMYPDVYEKLRNLDHEKYADIDDEKLDELIEKAIKVFSERRICFDLTDDVKMFSLMAANLINEVNL